MTARPLPRSFDAIVVVIAGQAHLAAVITVLTFPTHYRRLPVSLALVGLSLAVPLACLGLARRRGGLDLPLPAFAAAGAVLLAIDVASGLAMRPAYVGSGSMWSAVAVGVTVLTLSPYRPPRDLVVLAGAHAAVIAVILALHRGQPSVEPFAVLTQLSAALIPAVAAAEFVRVYVRAVQRRQDAVAAQAAAQTRSAAAAAVRADADERLARLRTEVLPLLEDVAAHRLPVGDAEGARRAERLSAELRRELVHARSGAWLLNAPVAALGRPAAASLARDLAGTGSGAGADDEWPGVVLLDPQRLVGRLDDQDRAALSAVLAALRAVGGWASVSVALSRTYPAPGSVADPGTAFVTVVAHALRHLDAVDPAVVAAAERAGCVADLEPPLTCVVEGTVPVRPGGPGDPVS